jgi:phage-related protein
MAQYQFTVLTSLVPAAHTTFTDNGLSGASQGGIVTVDRGLSRSVTQNVLVANFGDGYEQRVGDGINTKADTFSVTFNNRTRQEINALAAFFDIKTGQSFEFTVTDLPLNAAGTQALSSEANTAIQVVCDTYNITYIREDFHNLSATFRRVYNP